MQNSTREIKLVKIKSTDVITSEMNLAQQDGINHFFFFTERFKRSITLFSDT